MNTNREARTEQCERLMSPHSQITNHEQRITNHEWSYFFPAAWSRNWLNSDSSLGTQRSSRIPDQPPTDILSLGMSAHTLTELCHGWVYSTGSISVILTRSRFALGRSHRSSS